jgi:hypothetical protein
MPTAKSGSRGFIKKLFCNFWTLLQISTNFGSLKQFPEIKTIEKNDYSDTQCRAPHSAHGLRHPGKTGPRAVAVDGLPRGLAEAHRRLTCYRVGGEGTEAAGRVRRERRLVAGLTQSVARQEGGGQWCGAVAVDGGGAGTVVTDDGALALHHGDGESEVRWG